MRGMSRSCVFTVGADGHGPGRQPQVLQRSARARRDRRSSMMIAPARNFLPLTSKSSSAAGHLHARILEAEGDEVVVGRVLDDERVARALDAAGGLHRAGDARHRLREDALVAKRRDLDVAHVLERPAGVVVGARVLRRVVLHREVHLGERAERLIAADDVIAGRDVDVAGLERGAGAVESPAPASSAR